MIFDLMSTNLRRDGNWDDSISHSNSLEICGKEMDDIFAVSDTGFCPLFISKEFISNKSLYHHHPSNKFFIFLKKDSISSNAPCEKCSFLPKIFLNR